MVMMMMFILVRRRHRGDTVPPGKSHVGIVKPSLAGPFMGTWRVRF